MKESIETENKPKEGDKVRKVRKVRNEKHLEMLRNLVFLQGKVLKDTKCKKINKTRRLGMT